MTVHPHAVFLLDFDRSTEDAPRKGHNVECCCASRRQTSVYGRVKGERGRVRDRETDRQRQTETEKERFEFG
jgi:hypothetical protein